MRYSDPKRPWLGHFPAYCFPDGSPIAQWHGLRVAPGVKDDFLSITATLAFGPNDFAYRVIQKPTAQFPAFWQEFLEDLEGALERHFSYQPTPWGKSTAQALAKAIAPAGLSLEDLGL